jgi:DNA adenine methylase
VQYVGGKARIARHIVAAVLADTDSRGVWFEPFVGGGNVLEAAAPYFDRCYAADVHPDLIMMWEYVTAGGMIPQYISREEYAALRYAEPSWLRGLAGFGASFGGCWFGGYGLQRIDAKHPTGNVYSGTRKTIERQAAVFGRYGVRFRCVRFGVIVPPAGSVVYCDPPYAGAVGYAPGEFDRAAFFDTLTSWAACRHVYVSEYVLPAGVSAKRIWSGTRRTTLKASDNSEIRIESLFRILP